MSYGFVFINYKVLNNIPSMRAESLGSQWASTKVGTTVDY